MSPKAAEPSTKKFIHLGGDLMHFSNFGFPIPSDEEILSVKKISKYNPDDLDSRELWILENFDEGEKDD